MKHTATHKGNFQEHFGIDAECYVLDDENRTAVISKRGLAALLGFDKDNASGTTVSRFLSAKSMGDPGVELLPKLAQHVDFQDVKGGVELGHGYKADFVIDICAAIIKAHHQGALTKRHSNIVRQAEVLLLSAAKAGIKHFVYAVAGYTPTSRETLESFKSYALVEYRRGYPILAGDGPFEDLLHPPIGLDLKPGQYCPYRDLNVGECYVTYRAYRREIMADYAANSGKRFELTPFTNDHGRDGFRIRRIA